MLNQSEIMQTIQMIDQQHLPAVLRPQRRGGGL